MATYADYLKNLTAQKKLIVTNMNGIIDGCANNNETLNSLARKVPVLYAANLITAAKTAVGAE